MSVLVAHVLDLMDPVCLVGEVLVDVCSRQHGLGFLSKMSVADVSASCSPRRVSSSLAPGFTSAVASVETVLLESLCQHSHQRQIPHSNQVTCVTMKSVLSVSDAFKLIAKLTTIPWELEDYENIMSARSKYAHIITKLCNITGNYALNF